MEKFRVGDYEIEPQFGSASGRVVVRRVPNPYHIPLLYVNVTVGQDDDGATVAKYRGGDSESKWWPEMRDSWEEAIADAMDRIESQHRGKASEEARREAEATAFEVGLNMAKQELWMYAADNIAPATEGG